jgi:catechol 2,3-dioxygenase-like lactoylglutathione lyase family enzyme
MPLHAIGANAPRAPAAADGALRGKIKHRSHNKELAMAKDRFDHVFVEPTSFDASLAFYRGALGWTERFSWGGNGEPRGVSLASPGGMAIVLAEPHPATDHSKSHGINGTQPTLHLMVDDIEARHAELGAHPRRHTGASAGSSRATRTAISSPSSSASR